MSFDPRSLERLRELGRRLPQPLPAPQPAAARAKSEPKRHKVETEDNPEQLFRELMQASPDGSVPDHLLDRLRQLEKERSGPRAQPGAAARASITTASTAAAAGPGGGGNRSGGNKPLARAGGGRRTFVAGTEEAELYTAFQQLLLEDDEAD